ncbi:hypothetical protein GCM10027445_06810 [Amycolatopsis endophytica]|uniref:WD40 repeat protein n=1 Tax=Amycolatopsis endophytica TaxID=860233 RepID=A0A853AWA0_9PSEU|nr:hypothetical protein [Amycolatopsis endophytica]NYI86919.1 WD40 repeat protein [Amycolatopsis endophytica]
MRNPFRRRRTSPDSGFELCGHDASVHCLTTVPTADGVLLASGDAEGAVLLWDPGTGEQLAGPVTADSSGVRGLAAVELGDGDWALACCGADGVTLWDPRRMGEAGYRPRSLTGNRTSALAVVPAEPRLIVIADADAVRVVDPATGRQVFASDHPPQPRGPDADQVHELAGVRFGDTAGFIAMRYFATTELWEQQGPSWRQRSAPFGELERNVLTTFGSQLAVTARRGIEVWDLRTGGRTARGELNAPFKKLAPVSLGSRQVVAAAFREHHDCGVQLWDPLRPDALTAPVNRHGPAFGDPEMGGATINALVGIALPDGTARVASAANDGCVLISPPLGEDDLVSGQHAGAAPPRGDGGNFARVRTSGGEIIGLWFGDEAHARDRMLLETVLFNEDLLDSLHTEPRLVPNTYDDKGGVFVMFGRHRAPGELS